MKRIVLGSLLSCMLVGQVFGADAEADNSYKAMAKSFGKGLLVGSAQAVAPLVISKALHMGVDAAACVSGGVNPLGTYEKRNGYGYLNDYPNTELIPGLIKASPMIASIDRGIGYTAILGTFGAWGWNIWSGVKSWVNTESFSDKAKSAGRIIGSSITSLAVMKYANLARA